MRLMATTGHFYFKSGELFDENKNIPLNLNYLFDLFLPKL
jgi:hypothetical protein